MQVKKQQSELDMKQWTGTKLRKEYIKSVYYHSAHLTSMQSTSCKICVQGTKHQLEWDMKQQTDFKLSKEYVTAVYYHAAYLTYMQNTS